MKTMIRNIATGSALLCSVSLAGCASLEGTSKPIITLNDNLALVKNVPMAATIEKFNSGDDLPNGMSKREYRNMVLTIYLNAVDSQYQKFRTSIYGESHGANFGVDLAVIGLTSGASFASKTVANQLSAVASVFAGAKGSFDKNFYFDKTLPALLAAMDASRLKVRTRIVENMRKDENQYPLASAFADVNEYQMAATLDRAIDQITSSASSNRQSAVSALDDAINGCDSPDDMFDINSRFTDRLLTLKTTDAKDLKDLKIIAGLVGADQNTASDKLHLAIIRKVASNRCSIRDLQQLMTEINAKTARGLF